MKDLFGNETLGQVIKVKGARIAENLHRQLISAYGIKEGEKCKDCVFRIRFGQGRKTWSKCKKATPNFEGHLATDWRVAWQACGKFEQTQKSI